MIDTPQVDHPPEPGSETTRRWKPTGRTAFFGVVLVIFLAYTEMAFQMDWITGSGRIGPGFFPRIVGSLAVLIALFAIVDSLRREADEDSGFDEDESGEGDLGHHPLALCIAIGGSAVFLFTLTSLGAIISSTVFMLGLLAYLNRGRWLTNVALSVLVPLGMYLLFQTALNAGLPSGLLPRF